MDNIKKIKLTVTFLLVISFSFLILNLLASKSTIGGAFYINERGLPSIRDPLNEELPKEMENINIIFWAVFTFIFMVILLVIKFYVETSTKIKKRK